MTRVCMRYVAAAATAAAFEAVAVAVAVAVAPAPERSGRKETCSTMRLFGL